MTHSDRVTHRALWLDDRSLAYLSADDTGAAQLHTVDVGPLLAGNTAPAEPVMRTAANDGFVFARTSPDLQYVAALERVDREARLVLFRTQDLLRGEQGRRIEIDEDIVDIRWAADSSRLVAAVRENRKAPIDVRLIDLENDAITVLDSGHVSAPEPVWSQSQQAVYFISSKGLKRQQVYKAELASGELSRVSYSNRVERELSTDASGNALAISRFEGIFRLYVMDTRSGETVAVADQLGTQLLPVFAPTRTATDANAVSTIDEKISGDARTPWEYEQ